MSERIYSNIDGANCDAHECRESIDLPESMDRFAGQRKLEEIAKPLGWSMWANRGRRTYCPQHGPKPGSKLMSEANVPEHGARNPMGLRHMIQKFAASTDTEEPR